MILSKHSKHAVNAIEEANQLAQSLDCPGKPVAWLNRGDPPKFFPTPKYIIKAYIRALQSSKTYYADPIGLRELRNAVADRYNTLAKISISGENVLVTEGVSEALLLLNDTLIDRGDQAIIMSPYFPPYVTYLRLSGGREIIGHYEEELGWKIDPDRLRKTLKNMRRKIKYMLFANPNNPTGTVLERKELAELVDIANEHGVFIVSDEIYDEIVYNGVKFTSMASVAKGVPHMILHGASKVYDSTGFRIGFTIVPEQDKTSIAIRKKMADIASIRLSANTPAQYAILEAIKNKKEHSKAIKSMVKKIEERCNHAARIINETEMMSVVQPNGAFYMLPRIDFKKTRFKNDGAFADALLKKEHVYVTRGSGFGANSHIRIVALPPKEILEHAINRISVFLKENRK